MDPMTFSSIKGALKQKHFKDERYEVLRSGISATYGCISVDQVAELVREFSFDDEKFEAVKICVPKLSPAMCVQVVPLLSCFSFDGNKVKVVETIAHIIIDPASHHEFDRVISFHSDRNKARDALLARQSMGPPPTHHPPPQHYQPYPGHYPAGQVPPYPPAPGHPPYPGTPHPTTHGIGNPPHTAAGFLNSAAHAAVDGLTYHPHHPHHHGNHLGHHYGGLGYPHHGYPHH